MPSDIASLATQLVEHMPTSSRYFLGIAGPPGSGKSAFAAKLSAFLNTHAPQDNFATTIPLDGFHLTNLQLDRRGLRPVKGSPQTFDVASLTNLLSRLRAQSQTVMAPYYSRWLHEPVPETIRIEPSVKLIIVEGNYLLIDAEPWVRVRRLLDEVWYLDVPLEVCMERVAARHVNGGDTPEAAAEKIARNDQPNYHIVAETKDRADRVVSTALVGG